MSEPSTWPDDLDPLEESLLTRLDGLRPGRSCAVDPLTAATLFESQVASRLLDHTARWLRADGHGYYTIGSAGHESNAAVALALRPSDPALLHYRSGGFYVARASQVAGHDAVGDVLRGMLARTTDPISGGRHKVFGHRALNVIPQTSTIASHLPRAVGLAQWGARETGRGDVVVCSFGDASLNHSTAQGAFNWAQHTAHRGDPVPVLFVCEDNGLGISVPSPEGWVADRVGRMGMEVESVDGDDPAEVLAATSRLSGHAREQRRPALLHLRCVRYLGHAGSDAEAAYRTTSDVRADYERDPIVGAGRLLVDAGECAGRDLVEWYLSQRVEIRERALALLSEPEFESATQVMAPLAAPDEARVATRATAFHGSGRGGSLEPLTLAQTVNATLSDVLAADGGAVVFGEDVGRKGGVYGVTRGLQKEFGEARVVDTLLDEQSILGLALGIAVGGGLPIPEIQYLAYLHNAEDQLRGEAATLGFFSQGQYANPMVVRIAAYAYQRGFGGHFHNDHAVGVLRDIPGLVVASPAHPADAGPMLRTCAAAAREHGTVSAFLEPIARYHTTDLFDGDGAWLARPSAEHAPIGSGRVHGDGTDAAVVTWGNGLWLSLRAQRRLADEHGVRVRVLDLRWLAPLPIADLLTAADSAGRVLVADETRRSGGVGEGVVTALVEHGFTGRIGRVSARDSFVPLGAAANLVLLSEDDIVAGVLRLV